MATTALTVLILAGVALYLMRPEERAQLAKAALAAGGDAIRAARQESASADPFSRFLRARTGRAVVTPVLIALNTMIFILALFEPGALSDPQTLVEWGGNFAPRTTNGEWWRLVAATFVHSGLLHLLATVAALVPLGLILERAVGPVAFAAVYLGAGVLASVASLRITSPLNVSVGASGAVFGMYGLLAACAAFSVIRRPAVPIPWITVKRIAAAAAFFALYNLATDDLDATSELAGLITGLVGGLLVTRGIGYDKAPARRAAAMAAATLLIAVVCAVPLRGVVDVRPEIARIVEVEERTSATYDAAVAKFRSGRITARALAGLIEQTIVPELQSARARLGALQGVPREHVALVDAAEEYCRLREGSWRRRAEALVKSSMNMLREADRMDTAALEAFRHMKAASPSQ